MAVPTQSARPQFRRRLFGYAPGEVDAFVDAARPDGGDVVSARIGAEMAAVLRSFASSIVDTQQRAEVEVARLHQEAVEAATALRLDAEARAALLLVKAEAMRVDAEAAAEHAAQQAPARQAALREMAHEMVETVLADATDRFQALSASRTRARQALDEANTELQRAQATLEALASPDTDALRARAHEVVDLIALEAELERTPPAGAPGPEPFGGGAAAHAAAVSAAAGALASRPEELADAAGPPVELADGSAIQAGDEHHEWSVP